MTPDFSDEIFKAGRILVCLPISYSEAGGFWFRDAGLIVLQLRARGYDAWLVALRGGDPTPSPRPVIVADSADLNSSAWWQKLQPAAAILFTWSAPRYDCLRRAVLASTPKVLERLDTDGVRSPRVWKWNYLVSTWGWYHDFGGPVKRALALPLAFLRFGVVTAFPGALDRRMAKTVSQIPVLAAETPIAVERTKRFLRHFLDPIPEVVCIPHAVKTMAFHLNSSPKENRIVTVGRWTAAQKNFPLLLKVLQSFLVIHPEWSVTIIGELPTRLPHFFEAQPKSLRSKFRLTGKISHDEIGLLYNSAKIFFMSSRWESFNIAAAESLCCGCSVVGAADIPSVLFFTSMASGTPACRQTHDHFLDALSAEAQAWQTGARQPQEISKYWRETVGIDTVISTMLRHLSEIKTR